MPQIFVAIVFAILLVFISNATAQTDKYQVKDDAHTGSIIKRNLATSSSIPLDKAYSEMTPEQQGVLKSQYEKMGPNDEPPFPIHGLKPIIEAIVKANAKFRDIGALYFLVDVTEKGEAKSVSIVDSTSEEMKQFVSQVLFLTKYKPALCATTPCSQQYAFRFNIKNGVDEPEKERFSLTYKNQIGLAEQGNAIAQNEIGWMYYTGKGVSQSYPDALKWFHLAVDQGQVRAQTSLGYMYERGQGVAQNYVEAIRLYRLAANRGFAQAQINLGRMYAMGMGVPKDYKGAVKWYRLAAKQGNAVAQELLGHLYYTGHGVQQDYKESAKLSLLSAINGNQVGQNNIGWSYYAGLGVTQNFEEALSWLHKAAEQGSSEAKSNIGEAYRDGKGVTQDYAEALKWFRLSSEQKNANAQYNLGNMYFEGKGVPQDYTEALKWFRLSGDQEKENAQIKLGEMYKAGMGVDVNETESAKWIDRAAEQKSKNLQDASINVEAAKRGEALANCPSDLQKPVYPLESIKNNEEGIVGLSLYIGKDGYVLDSKIDKSSGFERLDQLSLNALDACPFTPLEKEGNTLPFWVSYDYPWRIVK